MNSRIVSGLTSSSPSVAEDCPSVSIHTRPGWRIHQLLTSKTAPERNERLRHHEGFVVWPLRHSPSTRRAPFTWRSDTTRPAVSNAMSRSRRRQSLNTHYRTRARKFNASPFFSDPEDNLQRFTVSAESRARASRKLNGRSTKRTTGCSSSPTSRRLGQFRAHRIGTGTRPSIRRSIPRNTHRRTRCRTRH